jgi:hypothetical protein
VGFKPGGKVSSSIQRLNIYNGLSYLWMYWLQKDIKPASKPIKLTSRNQGDNAWLARLLCSMLTSEDCSKSLE